MTRGSVPTLASDVFTCGLMLYELLAGEHPYWREDQAEYAKLVQAHAAKPPALLRAMPGPATNAEVSATLHRCLSPDPAARPTAAQLRAVLGGRAGTRPAPVAAPVAKPKPGAPAPTPVRAAAHPASTPIDSDGLELVAPNGSSLQLRVRTELGKAVMRRFGPDGEFWDDRQCVLERGSGRHWVVSPIPGTINETLVNGEPLTSPRTLRQGDLIAVGRAARGIVKLPLRARAH
jgi:hypothetical protein